MGTTIDLHCNYWTDIQSSNPYAKMYIIANVSYLSLLASYLHKNYENGFQVTLHL